MSESEGDTGPDPAREDEDGTPDLGDSLRAALVLLPVLGVLWLVITYLPHFGDWMGEKADAVVESVEGGSAGESVPDEPAPREPGVEAPEGGVDPETPESPAARDGSGGKAGESGSTADPPGTSVGTEASDDSLAPFRRQILEQLGGPERVEVRHLARSDDGARMVAALRLSGEAGEAARLVEVFFERDDFGRYLSTEDAPVESRLTLWPENE